MNQVSARRGVSQLLERSGNPTGEFSFDFASTVDSGRHPHLFLNTPLNFHLAAQR